MDMGSGRFWWEDNLLVCHLQLYRANGRRVECIFNGHLVPNTFSISFHDILYTQKELFKIEWLDEIIICTKRESLYLIDLLPERCQKEKGYLNRSSFQHTNKSHSIDLRHHAIDDKEVKMFAPNHIECDFSIFCDFRIISFRLEVEGDVFSNHSIIIDGKDFHRVKDYIDCREIL